MHIREQIMQLNASDLDFHAQRYVSAAMLQEAIEDAQDNASWEYVHASLEAALWATDDDGGDHGTIPCLRRESDIGQFWTTWIGEYYATSE